MGNKTKILYQLAGSLLGALFATWAGVADGAGVSDGVAGFPTAATAEVLLLLLLTRVIAQESLDR